MMMTWRIVLACAALHAAIAAGADLNRGAALPASAADFIQGHCVECHDADTKKGGLDLTAVPFDLGTGKTFDLWVKVHDRVRDGEMPPRKVKSRPDATAVNAFLETIAKPMIQADRGRSASEGRSVWRRLNRYEYENAVRDLLHAPWLQIKDMLP